LLDDEGECFRDLASAMMESRVNILRDSLIQQADNACYACYGAGTNSPLTDDGPPCRCCEGRGFLKLDETL
jgi:DnaJ-class molecular chaperone